MTRFPAHGPDLRALLRACHAAPDDDTPRLVLADWLQERDDPRGELMRLQCQIAALPAGAPEYDSLLRRHQKWWERYYYRWWRETGKLMWDEGPHDRGLPTIGHYEIDDYRLNAGALHDLVKAPKNHLSALIADGWPGMTWVFVEDPFTYDGIDPATVSAFPEAVAHFTFGPFHELPWAGAPTPVGVCFPEGMTVWPALIDEAAKVPNLRGVSLVGTQASPGLLSHLAKIPDLEHLDLGSMRLSDESVGRLTPLKRLRTLIAPGATITNAGAAALVGFPELRRLRLGARRLTAAGYRAIGTLSKLEELELARADDNAVRHLSGLTQLRRLFLNSTNVTGRGLEKFSLLTQLSLEGTPSDDTGLACVAGLKRLYFLEVSGTRITGALLSHLSSLPWLQYLEASRTAIHDGDLRHLESLKSLQRLGLENTRVTKQGINRLQKKLRNLSVN